MVSDHILIVDDEAPIRQLLSRWINAIGYATMEADSAEKGLEVHDRPIRQQWSSATSRCQAKADSGWPACCAHSFRKQRSSWPPGVTNVPATTSLRPGITSYVTKPFDPPIVRKAVERAMAWHDAAVASGPRPIPARR